VNNFRKLHIQANFGEAFPEDKKQHELWRLIFVMGNFYKKTSSTIIKQDFNQNV